MSVKEELVTFVEKVNANPEFIKEEKDNVFQMNLESGTFQIVVHNGTVEVVEGEKHNPEVMLTLSDKNFSKLLNDDLNATMAFMTGSLKVKGNIGTALKLQEIVKRYQ